MLRNLDWENMGKNKVAYGIIIIGVTVSSLAFLGFAESSPIINFFILAIANTQKLKPKASSYKKFLLYLVNFSVVASLLLAYFLENNKGEILAMIMLVSLASLIALLLEIRNKND
ncbi:MAG: hypothetical protein Q8Q32_00290 [bacterium]|nr:hypothetical protein [bacterium]